MLSDHKIQIPAVKKTLYYIIPLCLTSGLQAKSQPSISSDSTNTQIEQLWEKMYELKGVVVTGTRSPKKLRETPVLTRVITHKDIQKTDATNIQDLLQTELPGIEFTYAMNQQVNMNLAGFAGQSILILVDGERLAGETMDNVDFTRLSMADIERIEIVRGAASALYGSNAAGGVINIITRKSKEPWTLHLDARYGEHNQQRYNTILSLRQGIYANRLTFSHTSCDNYQVSNRGTEPQASTFTQVYGDKTFNLSDRMSIDLTKDLLLTGRLQYFYRTTEREEDSQERYRDYQANIKAQWHISPRDHLEASYNFDQYDKSDYLRIQSLDLRKYSNVQNNFRLLYNRQLRQSDILTIGADYLYDYLMNTNLTDSTHTQQSLDIFTQYDWHINDKCELLAALRYDYFSDGAQSRLTPKLAARWTPHRRLTLRSTYGMGFRAPTLKEKYYNFDMAGIWTVEGNPTLSPELSHNITFSAQYTYKSYDLTLESSYNRVTNKITTGLPYHKDNTDEWYLAYINLSGQDIYTVGATVQAQWQYGFSAKASYLYTHETHPTETANQYMPARPHSLTMRGEWAHDICKTINISIALSGRVHSTVTNLEYNDLAAPELGTHEVKYPAYTLWKLQLTSKIKQYAQATLTIDNLFNYRPTYYYYNAPLTQGINLHIGASIDIDKIFRK